MQTLSALDWASHLRRRPDAHKGDAGKVLIIGGAPSMSGALCLAGQAALYSGAGWVMLMMLDALSAHVLADQPELMVHSAASHEPSQALLEIRPDVLAIGPGLGTNGAAVQWLQAALLWSGPLVIDADALNLLASHPDLMALLKVRDTPTCLTPHPGEAARLLGTSSTDVQHDRLGAITRLTAMTQAVVVLKGQHSLVASPEHETRQCEEGNPGMAVGGMGDVLTGCVAALAAQGIRHQLDLWQATCLAVQLHARSGDGLVKAGVGPIGLMPSELAKTLLLQLRLEINRSAHGG